MPPAAQPDTLNLIVILLREFMGLAADQAVVYNQKWKIPADDRLYCSISQVAEKIYSNESDTFDGTDGVDGKGVPVPALIEQTVVRTSTIIGVDIYSRSQEAKNRRFEVVGALTSIYGQQLAEKYSMRLGQIPATFVNISRKEGTAILNRYHIAFSVMRAIASRRVVEYFSTFPNPALIVNP